MAYSRALQIQPTQLAQFEEVAQAQFCGSIIDRLLAQHGPAVVHFSKGDVEVAAIPRVRLRAMVEAALYRGRGRGLSWASTLTAFTLLMFLVSPDFDDHPEIRRALDDGTVPPDYCMRDIVESMTDAGWAAIRAESRANDWTSVMAQAASR